MTGTIEWPIDNVHPWKTMYLVVHRLPWIHTFLATQESIRLDNVHMYICTHVNVSIYRSNVHNVDIFLYCGGLYFSTGMYMYSLCHVHVHVRHVQCTCMYICIIGLSL